MSRLFALLIALVTAGSIHAQILLEDFATLRKNGMNTDLWEPYLGEDSSQTYALDGGAFRVNTNSSGYYVHFFPNTGFGYPFPQGFALNWIKSGSWDANINRLRFRFKCSQSISRDPEGGDNMQIGTYIKSHSDTNNSNQGAHYYHLLDMAVYANRWMIIELNRVPQHQVGQSPSKNWPENPSAPGVNYFDGLTRWYIDSQGTWSNRSCFLDQVEFDKETGEPDDQVSSIQATYTGSRYEVTWASRKNQNVQFEVRYSTASMHTNGFASGTAGGTVSNPGSDYTGTFWASPSRPEAPILYVAIRPSGTNLFTEIAIPNLSGSVLISDCDVNHDGSVTSQDVDLAIDAALGKVACTADLNADSRCDAIDAQRIINTVNGSSCLLGL